MKTIFCVLGVHDWTYPKHPEMLRSKAGLLMGTVEFCERRCKNCAKAEEVYRAGSLFAMYRDDTGWRRMTDTVRESIRKNYMEV